MTFEEIVAKLPKPYYSDDAVCIIHADCRDILPLIPEKSIDLVLTDPPYGVNFRENDWDIEIPNWLPGARMSSNLVIFTTGTLTLWDYPRPDWVICWARPASNSRSKIGGFSAWSPVLVYGKVKFPIDFKSIHAMEGSEERNHLHHPTPKPERLWEWIMVNSVEVGQTILDLFLGSGTTAYCAKKLGRKCIGIEISEAYCEISAKRLSQMVLPLKVEISKVEDSQSELGLTQYD